MQVIFFAVTYAIKGPSNDPNEVHLEVKSKLEKELKKENIILQERRLDEAFISSIPVLVFCVLSSRIGTDVENALKSTHKGLLVYLVSSYLYVLECKH
jgi:hypothetical protein